MAREKETIIFNIIRFVAAIMVMAGHMAYIGGYTLPTLWERFRRSRVKNLLLIGGFLIAKSWESDRTGTVYDEKSFLEFFLRLLHLH